MAQKEYPRRCIYKILLEEHTSTGEGMKKAACYEGSFAQNCIEHCREGSREDAERLNCLHYHENCEGGGMVRTVSGRFVFKPDPTRKPKDQIPPKLSPRDLLMREYEELVPVQQFLSPEGLSRLNQLKIILGIE